MRTSGVRLPDGTVDDGEDAPGIDIYMNLGDDITAPQARQLARVLMAAADELDVCVAK